MDIIHSFLDSFAEQIARDLIIQFVLFWIVTCLFLRKIIIKNPKSIFTKNVINDLSYLITNKVIFAPMWLVIVIAIIDTSPFAAVSESDFASFINNMPFWQQLIIGMLVYDLFAYWRHRLLHSDALWPIHAIHHSSKELTWISGIRNHPLNTLFIAIFGVMIKLRKNLAMGIKTTPKTLPNNWHGRLKFMLCASLNSSKKLTKHRINNRAITNPHLLLSPYILNTFEHE